MMMSVDERTSHAAAVEVAAAIATLVAAIVTEGVGVGVGEGAVPQDSIVGKILPTWSRRLDPETILRHTASMPFLQLTRHAASLLHLQCTSTVDVKVPVLIIGLPAPLRKIGTHCLHTHVVSESLQYLAAGTRRPGTTSNTAAGIIIIASGTRHHRTTLPMAAAAAAVWRRGATSRAHQSVALRVTARQARRLEPVAVHTLCPADCHKGSSSSRRSSSAIAASGLQEEEEEEDIFRAIIAVNFGHCVERFPLPLVIEPDG